jgi:hypothetical protein
MRPMAGQWRMPPFAHIEGQIAFYKAELKITDAQLPQWNALADAIREGTKQLQQAYTQATQANAAVPAPEQLDRRMVLLMALTENQKAIEAPFKALYAGLSPEQQKLAGELMAEHLQAMRAAGL